MMTLNNSKTPRKSLLSLSIMLAAIGVCATTQTASADEDISNLWEKGKFTLDARVRFEGVDVDKQLPSDTIKTRKRGQHVFAQAFKRAYGMAFQA